MGAENMKKQIMGEVERAIDALLEKCPPGTEITITQIERLVGEAKEKMAASMSQSLAETIVANEGEQERRCEGCGGALRSKGQHAKTIQSEQGALTIKREYLYCPQCEAGFFPPG